MRRGFALALHVGLAIDDRGGGAFQPLDLLRQLRLRGGLAGDGLLARQVLLLHLAKVNAQGGQFLAQGLDLLRDGFLLLRQLLERDFDLLLPRFQIAVADAASCC